MNQPGKVYLVGAGCGEADLITVRGLRLLQNCDTVIYDDLIAEELLDAVPANAEKIYVGKRLGKHSWGQEQINALLVQKAQQGKAVVRLKGGDPYVFGRGGEEMLALQAAGIPCEAVPGITSAIAIPALAGIPVTHRKTSRSIHIITGHTTGTPDGLPADLDAMAGLQGTLVFLMGLHQLDKIAARLMAGGMAPDMPAAVLSGGNSPHPATVRGTLADIAQKTRAAAVRSPAVIVVGPTAAMQLGAASHRPLAGVCVALTGTDTVTDKLAPALAALGAEPFLAQRSVVSPLPLSIDLRSLCDGKCHWLVFTSSNGVKVFFRRLRENGLDPGRLSTCRFAAVGAATRAELLRHGVAVALMPEKYTTEALARELLKAARPDEDVYLLRSRQGSGALYETLAQRFAVQDIFLYDVLYTEPELPYEKKADCLVFTSSGGIEAYLKRHTIPADMICVSIGEVTTATLQKYFSGKIVTARDISTEGIVWAITALHHNTEC